MLLIDFAFFSARGDTPICYPSLMPDTLGIIGLIVESTLKFSVDKSERIGKLGLMFKSNF